MKKHIGSTIALILGFLSFAGSVANPANPGGLIAGPVIILGALAYRSAKKRKLGEVHNTAMRKGLEISALIIIAAAILLQNDLKTLIATDPVPNLVIPLWAIIAYVVIASKAKQTAGKTDIVGKDA
jgi:hypothetical protein